MSDSRSILCARYSGGVSTLPSVHLSVCILRVLQPPKNPFWACPGKHCPATRAGLGKSGCSHPSPSFISLLCDSFSDETFFSHQLMGAETLFADKNSGVPPHHPKSISKDLLVLAAHLPSALGVWHRQHQWHCWLWGLYFAFPPLNSVMFLSSVLTAPLGWVWQGPFESSVFPQLRHMCFIYCVCTATQHLSPAQGNRNYTHPHSLMICLKTERLTAFFPPSF